MGKTFDRDRACLVPALVGALVALVALFLPQVRPAVAETVIECRRNLARDQYLDKYLVKIEVDTTTDADGWNDAWINVNSWQMDGTRWDAAGGEGSLSFTGLADRFDSSSGFSVEGESPGFPHEVEIYTDFGGGVTWRSWEANVTVYVNGYSVATQHLQASSSAWSSSDVRNTISIGEDKFPQPEEVYVQADETVVADPDKDAAVNVSVAAHDQYGTLLRLAALVDEDGTELAPSGRDNNGDTRYHLTCPGPHDRDTRYEVRLPAFGGDTFVTTFGVAYRFRHQAKVMSGGVEHTTISGLAGEEVPLDFPELVEPGYGLAWTLEGGGTLVPRGPDGPRYVFGNTDGVLSCERTAYAYSLVLDGNGATGGSMTTRIVKVGTEQALPSNTYSRRGYTFKGWNREPDGSGEAFADRAVYKDLSVVNNDIVTLYAQWEPKLYTVTFSIRATNQSVKVQVPYGSAAQAPEVPAFVPINNLKHNRFVSWNKSFDNILRNVTVSATYQAVPHSFVESDGAKVCVNCGYVAGGAATAGSVFGSGSAAVIGAGLVASFASVAWALRARLRAPDGKGDAGA